MRTCASCCQKRSARSSRRGSSSRDEAGGRSPGVGGRSPVILLTSPASPAQNGQENNRHSSPDCGPGCFTVGLQGLRSSCPGGASETCGLDMAIGMSTAQVLSAQLALAFECSSVPASGTRLRWNAKSGRTTGSHVFRPIVGRISWDPPGFEPRWRLGGLAGALPIPPPRCCRSDATQPTADQRRQPNHAPIQQPPAQSSRSTPRAPAWRAASASAWSAQHAGSAPARRGSPPAPQPPRRRPA